MKRTIDTIKPVFVLKKAKKYCVKPKLYLCKLCSHMGE